MFDDQSLLAMVHWSYHFWLNPIVHSWFAPQGADTPLHPTDIPSVGDNISPSACSTALPAKEIIFIGISTRSGWWFGTWLDYDFSFSWECHHPNWLSYGRYTTNQRFNIPKKTPSLSPFFPTGHGSVRKLLRLPGQAPARVAALRWQLQVLFLEGVRRSQSFGTKESSVENRGILVGKLQCSGVSWEHMNWGSSIYLYIWEHMNWG